MKKMSWKKEFFEKLRKENKNYKSMIDFCCDGCLIMNNYIIEELAKKDIFFETYSGE